MQETELRALIEDVREGKLPRRSFIQRMVALGLTAPFANVLLINEGIAQTSATIPYKGSKRGGGGALKLIWWQGAVHLQPHFAGGTKEQDATRIFYEPLAGWDTEGNMVPTLAAEIPSRANGGVSADGRQVTWKLKRNVKWHDGRDFTADDVLFTAAYAGDPATATVTVAVYKD
ncbi:MAG TPA: ABC transporter substrate-binding protein, partial [Rubrivivax sp.]|nr:ABC transporter substrate-binding protein [Rubrivivax sp.]